MPLTIYEAAVALDVTPSAVRDLLKTELLVTDERGYVDATTVVRHACRGSAHDRDVARAYETGRIDGAASWREFSALLRGDAERTAAALKARVEEAKAAEPTPAPPKLAMDRLYAIDCGPLAFAPCDAPDGSAVVTGRTGDGVASLSTLLTSAEVVSLGRLFAASIDLAHALLLILNADGYVSYRAEAVAALKKAGLAPEDAR